MLRFPEEGPRARAGAWPQDLDSMDHGSSKQQCEVEAGRETPALLTSGWTSAHHPLLPPALHQLSTDTSCPGISWPVNTHRSRRCTPQPRWPRKLRPALTGNHPFPKAPAPAQRSMGEGQEGAGVAWNPTLHSQLL